MITDPKGAKFEPGPGHYKVHSAKYRINKQKNAPAVTMGERFWKDFAKVWEGFCEDFGRVDTYFPR